MSQSCSSTLDMRKDRLDRLKTLHLQRNEARKLNTKELIEEEKRNKLPSNHEARQQRLAWQLEDIEARKKAEERGADFDRLKRLDVPADVAKKKNRASKSKGPKIASEDYEGLSLRQYSRNTQQIKPDMELYSSMKDMMGEDFYPSTNTLIQGAHYPSKSAVDKLVADHEKIAEKRSKYSRRRAFDPDAPIDYINEKNKRYNDVIERYYGEYTAEIKQSLERGTAV